MYVWDGSFFLDIHSFHLSFVLVVHWMYFIVCCWIDSVEWRTLYQSKIGCIAICIQPMKQRAKRNPTHGINRQDGLSVAGVLFKHLLYLTFRPTAKTNWEYSERCKLVTFYSGMAWNILCIRVHCTTARTRVR